MITLISLVVIVWGAISITSQVQSGMGFWESIFMSYVYIPFFILVLCVIAIPIGLVAGLIAVGISMTIDWFITVFP